MERIAQSTELPDEHVFDYQKIEAAADEFRKILTNNYPDIQFGVRISVKGEQREVLIVVHDINDLALATELAQTYLQDVPTDIVFKEE